MILFCGIPSEPPVQYAIDAAERAGIDYVLFNQRESHYSDIVLDLDSGMVGGALRVHETDWALERFSGIYIRLMEWNCLPENCPSSHGTPEPEKVEKSRLLHEALMQWIELTSSRVLNKGSAMSSNMSKPYQAQIIAEAGFDIPTTLITNDPSEVEEFRCEHGRIVYKSISSIRSIVREMRPQDKDRISRVRDLPTQFQAFVPGTNIRVHVVGEDLFATLIESDSVDYRYAGRDGEDVTMRTTQLPAEVQARCIDLSRVLNLPLCGIDLKRTPEGAYYCFEVNPSPAYTYYQEQTGQPIAEAIVSYMANGR